jgi:hypothetical protein
MPGVCYPPQTLEKIEPGDWIKAEFHAVASNDPVIRQLPPERNPEVLERALEITMRMHMGGYELSGASYSIIASNVEQAIRELESEAGDDPK